MSSGYVTIGQPPFREIRGQKLPSVKRANRNIQQHRTAIKPSTDSITQYFPKSNIKNRPGATNTWTAIQKTPTHHDRGSLSFYYSRLAPERQGEYGNN
jgi:hypothetical protein